MPGQRATKTGERRPHHGRSVNPPCCGYARSRWHTRGASRQMPGMETVWPLQIRCRAPESLVFKPTLTVRPD